MSESGEAPVALIDSRKRKLNQPPLVGGSELPASARRTPLFKKITNLLLKDTTKQDIGIPEPWFDAYRQANILIPQANFAIQIFVLASVLENPPSDWGQFANSTFSTDQVRRLGEAMTHAHRAVGVPVANYKLRAQGEDYAPDLRLKELWDGPRTHIHEALLSYIHSLSGRTSRTGSTRDQVKLINDFYKTEQGKKAFDDLRKGAVIARDTLRSPEVREQVQTYRSQTIRQAEEKQMTITELPPGSNVITNEDRIMTMTPVLSKIRGNMSQALPQNHPAYSAILGPE